jgi:hypothetical protein
MERHEREGRGDQVSANFDEHVRTATAEDPHGY